MTPAERRRMNFKKAGTKAYQPHLMKNIKKDKINQSATIVMSISDDDEPKSGKLTTSKKKMNLNSDTPAMSPISVRKDSNRNIAMIGQQSHRTNQTHSSVMSLR